ncbi:polymeric immunoglobulin receptor-like [Alosa pseudoharengus]|uniref:polymeric immunoglobulin receptor-like n=1 Tax=Alosa pseudoharengus TaxID=34774 RepID=UPI003F8AB253
MTMIWLYMLFLSSVNSQGEIKVKGFAGGGIIIKCTFKNLQNNKDKYFCKEDSKTTLNKCPDERMSTGKDNRLFEYYNTTSGTLHVHIKNLSEEDAGQYQCGAVNGEHIPVTLTVKKDDCCVQPISKTAPLRSSVDIRCIYPKESESNSKHFCKLSPESMCADLIASKTDETRGRFSIVHDADQKRFTVTIIDLTRTDSGVYWCGVRTGAMSGSMALITDVNIQVRDEITGPEPPPSKPPSTSAATPGSASGQPMIAAVCGGVAVMVLTIAVFMYFRCWRAKASEPASSSSTDSCRDTGNKRAPQVDCVYEEIQDSSSPEGSSPVAEGVYTLAHAPAEPSDDPGYATVSFNRNPNRHAEATSTAMSRRNEMASEYATVK